MTALEIAVYPTPEALSRSVAARVISAINITVDAGVDAHVCLTGGRGGHGAMAAIAATAARQSVDWRRVHFWWSDERFLPSGDPERNETGAREALLDHIAVPEENVHPMPSSDTASDPGVGAEMYVAELGDFADPTFCISLLGMGEDGHVASLFPEHPGLYDTRVAFAVTNSPKPPPNRISMSFDTINRARDIVIIAAGEGKAGAVGVYVNDPGPLAVPAAGVHGTSHTILAVDLAAAATLPPGLSRRGLL